MEKPITATIEKLVMAGERAGVSVERMIDVLRNGMSVETLVRLIEQRLAPPASPPSSSRWIM